MTEEQSLPPCPECVGENMTYEIDGMMNCPLCGLEWKEVEAPVIKDSNGTPLSDGDTVSVIKDLKVKGSSTVVKVGTKVKNIRLVDGDHDIDCKVPGVGPMGLKSQFVKKVND